MKQTDFFIPTMKDTPKSAEIKSHILMLKAGYIKQTAAGIYTYMPMATKILENIKLIIREEIENIGGCEILMPALNPASLWIESGRWDKYGDELMRLKDKNDREFFLGPTHEETIIDVMRDYLKSYKKLPINVFQMQTKFRDETRPRYGLLRAREFQMFDGYSFHIDNEGLQKTYEQYIVAYEKIFERLNINYKKLKADSGSIGGNVSMEFMALSEIGEDFIIYNDNDCYNLEIVPFKTEICEDIKNGKIKNEIIVEEIKYKIEKGIEIGHIFQLGDIYSKEMKGMFQDKNGDIKPYLMGCYGIGISRLLSAIIEQNYDDKGIILPKSITPFDVHIIKLVDVEEVLNSVLEKLDLNGITYLIDDRNERPGVKFSDSELIGFPTSIIIGKHAGEGIVEIRNRKNNTSKNIKIEEIITNLK